MSKIEFVVAGSGKRVSVFWIKRNYRHFAYLASTQPIENSITRCTRLLELGGEHAASFWDEVKPNQEQWVSLAIELPQCSHSKSNWKVPLIFPMTTQRANYNTASLPEAAYQITWLIPSVTSWSSPVNDNGKWMNHYHCIDMVSERGNSCLNWWESCPWALKLTVQLD